MATDDWDGDDGAEWWSRLRGWLEIYEQLRPLYDGDFYPLTAYSLSSFDWLGWQLHRGDLKKGMLLTSPRRPGLRRRRKLHVWP